MTMSRGIARASSVVLLMLGAALLRSPVQAAGTEMPPKAREATVPRDGKFEASFTLPDQTGNPFDSADNDVVVHVVGPMLPPAIVPAFWDGDRWRVRYAPLKPGDYVLSVTRNGHAEHPADLAPSRFRCVPSADPGFVRRDPAAIQRFVFDNGEPYYPLGMNVAWINGRGPGYPEYFQAMGAAHMNWARVWMTYWDGKALEWSPTRGANPPRGTFLLDAARRWDHIFDAADAEGIYVQMVLQHHGQYTNLTDPNWRDNPFNVANGGFLQNPDDFFTDPEACRLTRAKFRYIVARWGYSTHLLSYELFNEVQNIGEARLHFSDVVAWHQEMVACIRSLDTNHHLITTSNSVPGQPLAEIGLDYDQIHTYPADIVSAFTRMTAAGVPVPVFFGEWGPENSRSGMTAGFLHDGLWASLMAPTAGAAQFWFWDQVMAKNWWPEFASAAGFVQTLGIDRLGPMTALDPTVMSSGDSQSLTALAKGNSQAAVFWVYSRDRAEAPASAVLLTLPGLTPGNYAVRLWDTKTGRATETLSAMASASPLTVRLPGLSGEVAGVITRQKPTSTSAGHSKPRSPGQSR